MIILKTLKWSNIFSYGENNILDLSEQKITQILGTNGVGKSSIPLILEEILFNKNSKGIKKADIPNRLLNNGYSINLCFEKNRDKYEIDLSRKSSIKVKLIKNGEDISSHTSTNTYKNIEEIIGIDFKTFSQIVYQNTNASLNFLTATDSNRKKFLIDLLGLEQYSKIFENFKAVSKQVDTEYANIEGKISTIEKWLEKNKLIDTTPLEFVILPKISEEEQNELSNLIAEYKNISTTNRKISQNNQFKDLLKSIDIDSIKEITESSLESYDELQSKVGEAASLINLAKKEISKLDGLKNECPTCGQQVSEEFKENHVKEAKEQILKQTAKRESIEKEIKEIQEKNKRFTLKQKRLAEWQELFNSIDKTLPASVIDANDLNNRIDELKLNLQRQQKQVEEAEKRNQQVASHNTRIDVILEQTKQFQKDLKELREVFVDIANKKANLEILKKAFSTNGLIAYKIENLVKELEIITGEYLSELSDGRFTLNFTVVNDKLNVEITDNGKVVDILALSSGELARVNTATLLGIRKIMSSISSSKINVLFLDEVMNVLDEQGREKLVEVLLEEDLNTYIVSHQWSHPLLEKIEVQKVDGISRIVK